MDATPLFTWIHLSDIHVGHGDATHVEDQKLVLSSVRKDLVRMLDEGAPPPDAIFVTGDIAFSGAIRSTDEYTRAEQWLLELGAAAGVSVDNIFVVPGNHDIQRSADKALRDTALLRSLRDGTTPLDQALGDDDARVYLERRQANYLGFAKKFAPACRLDAERAGPQLYWRQRMVVRDHLHMRIIGLNTALLAAEENVFQSDQGRLRLGTKQLSGAFTEPEVRSEEVVLVLSHHPLQDHWLGDDSEVAPRIRNRAHIHLSGHVHDAASAQTRAGSGMSLVSVSAGAVHGEKTPRGYPARHGYNWGALVMVDESLELRVWPRMWSAKNDDFRLDADNVPHGKMFAKHSLTGVRVSTQSPRKNADLLNNSALRQPSLKTSSSIPASAPGPVIASHTSVDRDALLMRLYGLLPSQLGSVIIRLRAPASHLPPDTTPRATRANALVDWAEQPHGPGLAAVASAIDAVVSGR